MAFELGELVSTGISFVRGDTGPSKANPEAVSAAAAAYGLTGHLRNGGSQEFDLPKMKFMFGVQFVLTDAAQQFLTSRFPSFDHDKLSFVVKDVDLPSTSFETYTVNQYNRKRTYVGKVSYDPIKMSLYDLQDATGMELYDAYRAFHYGDFYEKNDANWEFNQTLGTSSFEEQPEESGFFEGIIDQVTGSADDTVKTWGRNMMNQGDLSESKFFKRIDIFEFDNKYYTVHNIHNPVISAASLDTKAADSDGDPQLINLTFEYEGTTNNDPLTNIKAIGAPIELLVLALMDPSKFGKDGNFQGDLALDEMGGFVDDLTQFAMDAAGNVISNFVSNFVGDADLSGNETASAVEGTVASDGFLDEVKNDALDSIGGLF